MILLFTTMADDVSVTKLHRILQAQGADTMVISLDTMEQLSSVTIAGTPDGGHAAFQLADRRIAFRETHAAWLWRSWVPHPLVDRFRAIAQQSAEWAFFEGEWRAFHKGVALLLAQHGVFCVNPIPASSAFEEKCCQLWLAAEEGLCIPSTLYTARLPMVQPFYEAHSNAIIYKPFRPFFKVEPSEHDDSSVSVARLLTNRVHADHLVEHAAFVPTPGIFQPYIEKQLELRIVVVGTQIFACAIHSQASERAREDWRRYDIDHTPHVPYDLPDDITQKLLRLMQRMGLVFGSIDMILTPEGDYVFLEVNPNGQFDWIAELTGFPIYEHLAAMLLAGSVEYRVDTLREASYDR